MGIRDQSELEESKLSVTGPRSECHNVQLIEVPVFFLKSGREYYPIGKTFCCVGKVKRGKNWEICHKPNPRYPNRPETMFANKYLPKDFTQELWDEMKEIGPGYQEDFGFWVTREAGRLAPLTYGAERPRKTLIDLPTDFKMAAAGDEGVPF